MRAKRRAKMTKARARARLTKREMLVFTCGGARKGVLRARYIGAAGICTHVCVCV